MELPALEGRYGDHPDAVRVGDAAMSWEALRDAADAMARRIAGAPSLAVHATPTLDTVVAVVAGLRAGVPVVPVPADVGEAEREHIRRDVGGQRSDAALVLYTSGTTGPPKGAMLGADAIGYDLDALADAWQWTPDDTLVHGLPLYHVHGLVLGVLGALRVGSRLVHTGRPTPAAYARANGSLYFGVPTVWSRVCADPAAATALRSARLLVSGSAALPAAVFEALTVHCGQPPVERYGMTETLITISARADGPRRPGTVGTALPGIETRLGPDGELEVRGPTVFRGYLNQPPVAPGWFATGDIAVIEPDGTHRIVGRASVDLIKSGGYRIGAGEVEEALLAHPGVREAAVVGAPHADLGQEVVAYVVADGVSEATLIEFVAARLARHKRPRRVLLRDSLPRNALGKVQKQLL